MADRRHRIESSFIKNGELVKSYASLIRELALVEMPATFAFVMAFTLKKDELSEWLPRLADVEVDGSNWMRNFRRAEEVGDFSGWFCPEALDLVRDSGIHEIACHGFRHVPIGDSDVEQAEAVYELRSARDLARRKGVELKTYVFPRNRVGHLAALAEQGYIGFRNAHPRLGRRGRIGNLGEELNMWASAQSHEDSSLGLVSIPGGYFLNWRQGLRRAVPKSVSLRRWRSILNDAAKNDSVATLYLHPHNLIDGPDTLELFRGVLRIAADLREARGLSIITQEQYCYHAVRSLR